MNKIVRTFSILTLFLLVCPALGQADIVYIKSGDKLFGTIQSPSFTVQAPYGEVSIKSEFLKSVDYRDGSVDRWTIETINNDRFSGILLNDSIQFLQEDGKQRELNRGEIQRIKREISGPSHSITTTIFTMKNNDRFSGKFSSAGLEIQANYLTKSIQPGEINRIEFTEDYQAGATILLENGDLISGTIDQKQIRVAPDAFSEFTVATSTLKSIQFNAPKMVLNKIGNTGRSEKNDGSKSVNNHHLIQDDLAGNFEIILFDFDRYKLKPQYYAALDEIALRLSQDPDTMIEIKGHTDNVGTAEYNQILSEKRAETVKDYLVQKGVEKDRLFPKGFGYTVNQASNETETGRALNRRVEMSRTPDQTTLAYEK